jgi:hypothetical protein
VINAYFLHPEEGGAGIRWDEMFVEDLWLGKVKRPHGFPEISVHRVVTLPFVAHAVVSIPAGALLEEVAWVQREITHIEHLVLFLTSDEGALFPIDKLKHPDMTLWVQTPRPEVAYPAGTRFFGVGSARAGDVVRYPEKVEKTTDWFYRGQGDSHPRRIEAIQHMAKYAEVSNCEFEVTPGFLQGVPRVEYLSAMAQAKVVPCPTGILTQDTFRMYEAIEMGCVPIIDHKRSGGGGQGFWDLQCPGIRAPKIRHWEQIYDHIQHSLVNWEEKAAFVHTWWHERRWQLANQLRDDLWPDEQATKSGLVFIIPTSPIYSHPSTDVIMETIESIWERAGDDAEIIVLVDGVRREQMHRKLDYYEYVHRLCLEVEGTNVTPILYEAHRHQAGMLARFLAYGDWVAPWMCFVEHDTPLVGEIPFDQVLVAMRAFALSVMRFSHEAEVLEPHRYMVLDDVPLVSPSANVPFVRTVQWSQRPHVARTDFYREILDTYFSLDDITMIEDVIHGKVWPGKRMTDEQRAYQWERWRIALYHPPGDIKRSTHTDGRAGEAKYQMTNRGRVV